MLDCLGSRRAGVLGVVGFVHNEHVQAETRRHRQGTKRLIGRHPDTARTGPCPEVPATLRAVQTVAGQQAVTPDLARPVHDDARWADHQEVLLILRVQVAHGSKGLNALAQTHLIPQDRPLLHEGELGSEGLIAAQ